MDSRQGILPFRRFVMLPTGSQATLLPTRNPISRFVCSTCNLGFKTKQGLLGHTMSTVHKARMTREADVSATSASQQAPLVFAASSSTATSPGTMTSALEPMAASSSASSSVCGPTEASAVTVKAGGRRKTRHVKVKRAKLTRGAAKRCKWSVLRQAEILETMLEAEPKKQHLEVAETFNVPVGNISRWWTHRELILKKADELRQRMLLGLRQRQRSDDTSSLKIHWKYNQSLQPLLKHIELQILARQKAKRPVTLGWVRRIAVAQLAQMKDIGVVPMFRGQPLRASRTWCWRMMVTLGYTSRRRAKIRPTSIEVAPRAIK